MTKDVTWTISRMVFEAGYAAGGKAAEEGSLARPAAISVPSALAAIAVADYDCPEPL